VSELREQFLDDHRVLTRGIDALRKAVADRDFATARRLADDLDRAVGAHIEFEERYLYPSLEPFLGHDVVRNLYDEHRAGRAAIDSLRSASAEGRLDYSVLDAQLRTMAEHALTCGTLTSHVESLDEETRRDLLRRLRELRATTRRWTELQLDQ
jgi:hypothetical protein